jgi:hypothetical protein
VDLPTKLLVTNADTDSYRYAAGSASSQSERLLD